MNERQQYVYYHYQPQQPQNVYYPQFITGIGFLAAVYRVVLIVQQIADIGKSIFKQEGKK